MNKRQLLQSFFAASALAFGLPMAQAQTPIKFQLDWRFEGPAALFLHPAAKGYFKAAGIEVKFQPFSSASGMIAPLASGELDVGSGAVSAGHYNANERQIRPFNRSLCAAP